VVDFHHDLVRNSQAIGASQALLDELSDDPRDQAVATGAESAHGVPGAAPLVKRAFDCGTAITYPLANLSGQGTRFSSGVDGGVWYGALDLESTVYESVHPSSEFVADSFAPEHREIIGERRVYAVRCDAIPIDLCGKA